MTPLRRCRPAIPSLALGLALGACAHAGSSSSPVPVASCEAGDSLLVREVIYFGRNRPSPPGGEVTDAEWQAFLQEVVAPRFPDGFTIMDATGQWRGASGVVETERSEVVIILHPGTAAAVQAVDQVIAEYKERFGQEAVLRERNPTCARF